MGYGKSRYGRGTYYGHGPILVRDASAPYIISKLPANNAQNVNRITNIKFTITDDSNQIVKSSIKVWVRGIIIFNNGAFIGEWASSSYESAGLGFTFNLIPAPSGKWAAEETVTIRVYAMNSNSTVVDESWKFYVSPRLANYSIYPMLFKGMREVDEDIN